MKTVMTTKLKDMISHDRKWTGLGVGISVYPPLNFAVNHKLL